MSVFLAFGAASLYAAAVVGIHRWNVRRLRAAGGFSALERLDWDTLIADLLPTVPGPLPGDVPDTLPSGEATPERLLLRPAPGAQARRSLLAAVIAGGRIDNFEERAEEAGFGGAELNWVTLLRRVRKDPAGTLLSLEQTRPTSAAEVYLREYLRLTQRLHSGNLELAVFGSKRRLSFALSRFGDQPCLYFARALASSRVGLNRATIDDMARAVYFSRQAPFYLHAVLETPYITEVRPALAYQCRHALDAPLKAGQRVDP